ncbi:helix-turn-helix transcriptional regulator [Marinactinospora thermotolerans]|uniref:Predicted transcriptional regulator, ArsR family n=1 Tax=Marinactinospora thermotolerans DSM 45154 TaxID=1122192 RepID=A0A1T4N6M4_9ACTN|nr:helix-turn-helix domain-containing protein [Marinactinospora thermotolerans]SJZ74852.1 Predicted transcriptional regulator, ArsR family [Marinactinospora thermotolerans DSM 45154]
MTDSGIEAVGALSEPLRRRLYRYVVEHGGEVSRAEAAEATGAQRNLVAFHLDKLVEVGLLEVTRRKVSGREGPGSGRPAKLYRRSAREHAVRLPPRDYETAAHLLAEAVERHGAEEALYAAARAEGARRGAALADRGHGPASPDLGELRARLEEEGYEPVMEGPGLRLRNCPFHSLAAAFPPLACGMNLELLRGLLSGAGADDVTASMRPAPGWCCVHISKNNKD